MIYKKTLKRDTLKSIVQDNFSSFNVLGSALFGKKMQGCSFLRTCGKICSNNLPQFDKDDLDSRLKALYDFLPYPCSFSVPFCLFPPRHLTF